MIHHCKYS